MRRPLIRGRARPLSRWKWWNEGSKSFGSGRRVSTPSPTAIPRLIAICVIFCRYSFATCLHNTSMFRFQFCRCPLLFVVLSAQHLQASLSRHCDRLNSSRPASFPPRSVGDLIAYLLHFSGASNEFLKPIACDWGKCGYSRHCEDVIHFVFCAEQRQKGQNGRAASYYRNDDFIEKPVDLCDGPNDLAELCIMGVRNWITGHD
jgi:hypothetical protein